MQHGGCLSALHFQSATLKLYTCIFQKYQHLSCLTQVICLDSNCSLEIANSECIILLFYNICLAHIFKSSDYAHCFKCRGHPQVSLRLSNHRAFGLFGLGGMLNGWISTLAFPMEEETWGQHKIYWWRGESIWFDCILRNLWMGMRIPDCCWVITFVPLACVALWNDVENRFTSGLCPCLASVLYFRKRYPVPRIRSSTQSQRYISEKVTTYPE